MKKYIIKSLILTFTFVFSTSCTDEFVNIDPVYSLDAENYFNSESDYNNALIGAYDCFTQATLMY